MRLLLVLLVLPAILTVTERGFLLVRANEDEIVDDEEGIVEEEGEAAEEAPGEEAPPAEDEKKTTSNDADTTIRSISEVSHGFHLPHPKLLRHHLQQGNFYFCPHF